MVVIAVQNSEENEKKKWRIKFWYQLYIATDLGHVENTECCDQCLF